ncbi:damage-inducible protein DinB [Bacillus sp. ISL-51]|uniref:DinB family protein n=1 Tax=Bacteria TaxID=2 RepID=UPI001BE5AC37|nr:MULTISPECIES: DinB family protein [Bacteria]MBT2573869.1 damage-inducible protein DinB [Bacillus sp. ISL-51]MBT2634799.1 damage-inducible protein DinB [Bacillus sp. ISL-26]MBT2712275.1 damage-inducible protein DinB [Pseudomonas sp. ISL-88]
MSQIQKLYDYHVWANQQIFQHLKNVPAVSLNQEAESVFPSVNAVLLHMCQADYVWLKTLYGETHEQIIQSLAQFKELHGDHDAIEHRMTALYEEYGKFLTGLEDTESSISISHPHYGTLHTTYADIIRHVVNHGTYHRGNISAMLHQMGHKGVPTDYIYFLYERRGE